MVHQWLRHVLRVLPKVLGPGVHPAKASLVQLLCSWACGLCWGVLGCGQAKRTESSLRLLQQRSMRRPAGDAAGGGGTAPTFTDTDKIILQLFLDVQVSGASLPTGVA